MIDYQVKLTIFAEVNLKIMTGSLVIFFIGQQ